MIPAKVNFVELNLKERESRFRAIVKKKIHLKIWIKGSKEKFEFVASNFSKLEHFLVFQDIPSSLLNQDILLNFEYNGQNFFGQGSFLYNEELEETHLVGIDKLYKSERRKNFRLLCYPLFNTISRFVIDDHYEKQNIVNFKSKANYDEIKKDFLALQLNIDESEVGTIIRARVHDISATGLGIYIGSMEEPYFPQDKIFKDLKIQFFDDVLIIPEAKVVYSMQMKSEIEGTTKVGINFESITENDEQIIVRKINQVLKEYDFDKDFEDFI